MSRRGHRGRQLPPLPLWIRLALYVVGGLLLVVGIAGLALPGIQGILTIAGGLALLSLASETVHRLLRWLLGRWPSAWKKVERFRRRLHRRLAGEDDGGGNPEQPRRKRRDGGSDGSSSEESP